MNFLAFVLLFFLSVVACSIRLMPVFFVSCHPTEESTAAPGEETTAVPPGKTTNNMEKKKLLIETV